MARPRTKGDAPAQHLSLSLHDVQAEAFFSPATEILYGGAAGGGKSFYIRACFSVWAIEIPNFQAYLFRRLLPDLLKTHVDGPGGFREILREFIDAGYVKIIEEEARFWNGSKIHFCHCQEETAIEKYLSTDIHALGIDEASQFSEKMIRFLRSRLRLAGLNIPAKYKKGPDPKDWKFPCMIMASNPGGIGHQYLKRAFIDIAPPKAITRMPKDEGGMLRQFIPARLIDNPSLDYEDYSGKLLGLGDPEWVRAYLEGDWNISPGAFLPEFGDKHKIWPFPLKAHWTRFMSFDWGSWDPGAIGWWAVTSEDYTYDEQNKIVIPADSLIMYREWYIANEKDEGLRLSFGELADGIRAREEPEERLAYRIAGQDLKNRRGQDSIQETLGARYGLYFQTLTASAGSRETGWTVLRDRFKGRNGRPTIYFFNSCIHAIRLLGSIQRDHAKVNDAAQDNDHMPECVRIACMSRPYASKAKLPPPPLTGITGLTLNKLIELEDKHRGYRSWR